MIVAGKGLSRPSPGTGCTGWLYGLVPTVAGNGLYGLYELFRLSSRRSQ